MADSRQLATDLRRALIEHDIAHARAWIKGRLAADRRSTEPSQRDADDEAYDVWLKLVPKPRPLAPGQKWHVFVASRSIHRPWVLQLYDVLREYGYHVFFDQLMFDPEQAGIGGLGNALSAAQAGILVWSAAAADAEWVRREYEVFERLTDTKPEVVFVPVRLDTSELPAFARTRRFLDFSASPDGPNGEDCCGCSMRSRDGRWTRRGSCCRRTRRDREAAGKRSRRGDRRQGRNRLLHLFRQGGLAWRTSAALGCQAATGLTRLGHPHDALEMLEQLETEVSEDAPSQAAAGARPHAPRRARRSGGRAEDPRRAVRER